MSGTASGLLRAYGPAVLTLIAGLTASLLFYQVLLARDEQTASYDFGEQAKIYVNAIEKVLDANIRSVRWSAAFLSIPVSSGTGVYDRHLTAYPEERSETLTLFWAPKVSPAERNTFERQAREIHADYAIYGESHVVEGDSYPVLAVQSPDGNKELLGYDFAAAPGLLRYLELARDTDKTFVIANCPDVKRVLGPATVLVISGVRADDKTEGAEDDAGRFIGYAIGAFQIDEVVDAALAPLNQELVNLQIFDAFAHPGEMLLYHRPAQGGGPTDDPIPESAILTLDRIHYTGPVELASTRRWLIVCTPTSTYLSVAYTWQPLLGLFAGLCLTAVVFEHFLSQIRQRRRAEALVRRRTAELQSTNEQLSTEIAARKQFESERDKLLEMLEQSNESLQNLNRRLAISNSDLQDFAVIASHDLKEPLRKVRVLAENLRTLLGTGSGGRTTEYIDLIDSCTERMQRLITNILQVSRVTTHGNPFTQVDLNEVARDVVEDLAVRIEETGGTIAIEALPVIEADPMQMRQLIQNLIDNGLKYGSDGSPPNIRIYSNGLQPSDRAPNSCEICVEDAGPGIALEDADRIFALFQRINGKGLEGGSGVGLAVCRKIAERHGGSITVGRAAVSGTRFSVIVPVTQPEAPEQAGESNVPGVAAGRA